MRRLHVVRGLVPAGALWLASPHPLHAQGAALVPVAEAYVAAWNAHDLPAVLALFAPDAVVRERRGAVPAAVWDTRDPQVVRAYLGAADRRRRLRHRRPRLGERPPGGSRRGRGPPSRGATASRRARTAPPGTRWAGRTRSSSTPTSARRASARPRATRRRWCAAAGSRGSASSSRPRPCSGSGASCGRAGARAVATRRAAPLGDGPSIPPRRPPRGGPAADPTDAVWPLALGGLALLGVVTMTLRRRRRS